MGFRSTIKDDRNIEFPFESQGVGDITGSMSMNEQGSFASDHMSEGFQFEIGLGRLAILGILSGRHQLPVVMRRIQQALSQHGEGLGAAAR